MVIRWLAVIVTVIVWGLGYQENSRSRLSLYTERDRSYTELVKYIDDNTEKGDIFLAGDESFGYSGIRPSFPFFHYISYGIYAGNLAKLERELKLVWDISLTPDFLGYVEQEGYASRGGLNGYLNDALQNLTAERIRQIKTRYSNFKYILLTRDVEFIEKDLPLREVFANEGFRVFEVVGIP